jgi:hypothetical protein
MLEGAYETVIRPDPALTGGGLNVNSGKSGASREESPQKRPALLTCFELSFFTTHPKLLHASTAQPSSVFHGDEKSLQKSK